MHLNQSPDVVAEVVEGGPPSGRLRTLLVTAGPLSDTHLDATAAVLAPLQVRAILPHQTCSVPLYDRQPHCYWPCSKCEILISGPCPLT